MLKIHVCSSVLERRVRRHSFEILQSVVLEEHSVVSFHFCVNIVRFEYSISLLHLFFQHDFMDRHALSP